MLILVHVGVLASWDQTKNKRGACAVDTFILDHRWCWEMQEIHFSLKEGCPLNNWTARWCYRVLKVDWLVSLWTHYIFVTIILCIAVVFASSRCNSIMIGMWYLYTLQIIFIPLYVSMFLPRTFKYSINIYQDFLWRELLSPCLSLWSCIFIVEWFNIITVWMGWGEVLR